MPSCGTIPKISQLQHARRTGLVPRATGCVGAPWPQKRLHVSDPLPAETGTSAPQSFPDAYGPLPDDLFETLPEEAKEVVMQVAQDDANTFCSHRLLDGVPVIFNNRREYVGWK